MDEQEIQDLAVELFKERRVWGFGQWTRELRDLCGVPLLPIECQSAYEYARRVNQEEA